MNIVEMQPTVIPSSFPVSDTRPSLHEYPKHAQAHPNAQYVNSRQSSKENKTPPPLDPSDYSPTSARSIQSPGHNGAVHGTDSQSPPGTIAGKKRLANGVVKDNNEVLLRSPLQNKTGDSRTANALTATNNAAMLELSHQLRTRLTYAMVKVQNGWQHRSLDEVESLASASPRSTTFNHYSENRHLLSPRIAMSTHTERKHSDTSSDSNHSTNQAHPPLNPILMSPPASRRGLAPPANIISRPAQARRRPPPNMHVNTGQNPSPSRPTTHRTPSQNAAMEADAVETLLFMASPHHSGNHGSATNSQMSPVTSVPSTNHFTSQTSPLRNTFSSPTSPKRVAFSSDTGYCGRFGRDKKAIIASLVERLDEDDSRELDEALKLMDRHHAATKVAAA